MNKKLKISFTVLSALAILLIAAIASGALRIGGDETTLASARSFALGYLANPDKQTFPIFGETKLLVPCLEPRIENEFVSHGKARYDFKVTCANQKVGYLFVSMREPSVSFIGVSSESPVLANRKAQGKTMTPSGKSDKP